MIMRESFHRFANWVSKITGSPQGFLLALAIVMVWVIGGYTFTEFSNTWQLIINTLTTIITFLMVFLIQNTQNRDAKAIHIKLDEIIKGVGGARIGLVDAEDLTDEELDELKKYFEQLHERGYGKLIKKIHEEIEVKNKLK